MVRWSLRSLPWRVRRPFFDDCLGMFLYAQLVLDLVQTDKQTDLDSILRALADLPEGLDQASVYVHPRKFEISFH